MLFTNLNSTPAGAPLGTFGLVNVLAALCVVPISYFCAPLGVNVGKNIAPVTLKRIFAVALFIISANMLYKGVSYYVKQPYSTVAATQVTSDGTSPSADYAAEAKPEQSLKNSENTGNTDNREN